MPNPSRVQMLANQKSQSLGGKEETGFKDFWKVFVFLERQLILFQM